MPEPARESRSALRALRRALALALPWDLHGKRATLVREVAKQEWPAVATAAVIAGALAAALGMPLGHLIAWALTAGAIPFIARNLAQVTVIPPPVGLTSPTPPATVIIGPRPPASYVWRVIIGAVVCVAISIGITWLIGTRGFSGVEYQQFDVETARYKVQFKIPVGVRNNQSGQIRAAIRDAHSDLPVLDRSPTLSAPATSLSPPVRRAPEDSERIWTINAPAGTYTVTLDYEQPMFQGATASGIRLPAREPLPDAGRLIEITGSALLTSMEVFNAVGVSTTTQNTMSAVGVLAGLFVSVATLLKSEKRASASPTLPTQEPHVPLPGSKPVPRKHAGKKKNSKRR